MFLIKMIKSGLVQIDKGFGKYPSQRELPPYNQYDVRPFVASNTTSTNIDDMEISSYQTTAKRVYTPFKNTGLRAKIVNKPNFGQIAYTQIFAEQSGPIADYVAEKLKGGEYFVKIGPVKDPEPDTEPSVEVKDLQAYMDKVYAQNFGNLSKEVKGIITKGLEELPKNLQASALEALTPTAGQITQGTLGLKDVKDIVKGVVAETAASANPSTPNIKTEPTKVLQPTEAGLISVPTPQRARTPSLPTLTSFGSLLSAPKIEAAPVNQTPGIGTETKMEPTVKPVETQPEPIKSKPISKIRKTPPTYKGSKGVVTQPPQKKVLLDEPVFKEPTPVSQNLPQRQPPAILGGRKRGGY